MATDGERCSCWHMRVDRAMERIMGYPSALIWCRIVAETHHNFHGSDDELVAFIRERVEQSLALTQT